jgi:hypothetical protein
MIKFIKHNIISLLAWGGSDIKFKDILNKFEGEKVLLVGDGISQIYALDTLDDYKYIIAVNQSSPLNLKLSGSQQICHMYMEPSISLQMFKAFISPKIENAWIRSIPKRFGAENLGYLVMHPYGAFFKRIFFPQKKILFCSPYTRLNLSNGSHYGDFTAALQAALGMALAMGFKHIDIVGFDAWLLTPTNPVRWYSNVENSQEKDVLEKSILAPEFLLNASKHCNLRTFTYGHYLSRYEFIGSISTPELFGVYSPKNDRSRFMSKINYSQLCNWESAYYPSGYDGSISTNIKNR